MSADRELLELAAKAAKKSLAGYVWQEPDPKDKHEWFGFWMAAGDGSHFWNPLTDDGDALRLAVKLRLKVEINDASIVVNRNVSEWESADPLYEYPESEQDDDYNIRHVNHDKATRRAIVRAAAEIGRAKP